MSASSSHPVEAIDIEVPSAKTLAYAARLAIEQDKKIMLDYYLDTKSGKAFLGEESGTKEKMLVKSADEYTSTVERVVRAKDEDDFIVITENSIYIVGGNIKRKTIHSGGGASS